MQFGIMAIIKAEKVSKKVVIVGNLNRQKIVNSLLENPVKISEFAGYTAYTGKYGNEDITTVFHGIGIPSLTLVTDDLISLGAREIVRFGSATAVSDSMEPGTVVLPIGYSYNPGGTFKQYLNSDFSMALTPDFDLLASEREKLNNANIKTEIGNVFTSDALFTHTPEFIKKLSETGHIAVELEGAGLYFISRLKNVRALSVHLIYSNAVTGKSMEQNNINESENKIAKTILDLLTEKD